MMSMHLKQPSTIAVIIPIYNALAETKQCIDSVLNSNNKKQLEIYLIEDCSTDDKVRPYIENLAQMHVNIRGIYHKSNKGFVYTVNEGIGIAQTLDIILLNSDTVVNNDWADRLCACAYSKPRIATVTPFSNNATLCSFPHMDHCSDLKASQSRQIDRVFSIVNARRSLEIPTGVGFCMYIRRTILDRIGAFSEQHFGRGYGEENDFCFRAKAQYWSNLLCADTYVHHHGGRSFSDEKKQLIEKAMQQLNQLHPSYHSTIQEFISRDPVAPLRTAALLAILANNKVPNVLILRHAWGGGTLKHINLLKQQNKTSVEYIELYPLSENLVALHIGRYNQTLKFEIPSQFQHLIDLCNVIKIDHIHMHHLLGLPAEVLDLPSALKCEYDITLHDYYLLEGNQCIIDNQGRYLGKKNTRQQNLTSQLSTSLRAQPFNMSVPEWKQKRATLLNNASRIISPSYQTSALYHSFCKNINITTELHSDPHTIYPSPRFNPQASTYNPSTPFNVIVIGALSKEKGADLLEATAMYHKELTARGKEDDATLNLKFFLVGYAYRQLDDLITVTGKYHDKELATKITALKPNLIWFPALWPETYSYTLSSVLALGLPILAPNIGAFPERLSGRPQSWVYDWHSSPTKILPIFNYIHDKQLNHSPSTTRSNEGRKSIEPAASFNSASSRLNSSNPDSPTLAPPNTAPARTWIQSTLTPSFYPSRYLKGIPSRTPLAYDYIREHSASFHRYSDHHIQSTSDHWAATALNTLRYLKRLRLMGPITKIIPKPWQQRIKARLAKASTS